MNKIKLASEPMTNIDKVAIGISYLKSLSSILTDGFDILRNIGDENAKKRTTRGTGKFMLLVKRHCL